MDTTANLSGASATDDAEGTGHTDNALRQFRARLLQSLLWVAAGLSLLNIIPMSYEFVTAGQLEISVRNVVLTFYILLVICTFAPRLPFTFRSVVLLLMFYQGSIVTLLDFGMGSASRLFALIFVTFAGLLFGGRVAFAALAMYVASVGIVAWLILSEHIFVYEAYREINALASTWRAYLINFVVTAVLMMVPVSYLIREQRGSMKTLETKVNERTAELAHRNADLESALGKVNQLSGLLPLCAACKRVRNDDGYWQQVDSYIGEHSEAEISHGICPECVNDLYPDFK